MCCRLHSAWAGAGAGDQIMSPSVKAGVLVVHQYFGSAILVLAGAAALMGHLEKAIWSNKGYGAKNSEAVLVNCLGVLIILFITGVTFLLSKFSKDEEKPSVH